MKIVITNFSQTILFNFRQDDRSIAPHTETELLVVI